MYGKRPMKLLNRILLKREIKIIRLEKESLIKILNSLKIKFINKNHLKEHREGVNQYVGGMVKKIIIEFIQLREMVWLVDGSKILKIFLLIIFIFTGERNF